MRKLSVLGALVCAGLSGCLSTPNFAHPGTAQLQRARAERFDPYPENEPGPTIVGGRPIDYEKPVPEVLRARWSPWDLR